MAGMNRLQLAAEALKKHDGELIGIDRLRRIITMHLSSKDIIGYLKLLGAAEIIIEEKEGWFRIHLSEYLREFSNETQLQEGQR